MNPNLTISFSADAEPVVRIKLEQKELGKNTGFVTSVDAAKFIGNFIYGEDTFGSDIDCGVDNGEFETVIYAYPYQRELVYELLASYGTLSERLVEEIVQLEIIQVQLEDEITLKYPAQFIESIQWSLNVFDEAGNEIPSTGITYTLQGVDKLKFSKKVYGTARVYSRVVRHTYELDIEMREEAIENKFASVAYAVYGDGLVYLELDIPPGADESDGYGNYNCGYGSSDITPEDKPPVKLPKYAGANRVINKDYCTQEVLSDSIFSTGAEYE